MSEKWEDILEGGEEFEDEEEQDDLEVDAEEDEVRQLTAEEAEAAEAQARADSNAQADAILREFEGFDSDAPVVPHPDSQDAEAIRAWTEFLSEGIEASAAKRAETQAVFDAEEAAAEAAAAGEEVYAEQDFSTWPQADWEALNARLHGEVPLGMPRGGIPDEDFEAALLHRTEVI